MLKLSITLLFLGFLFLTAQNRSEFRCDGKIGDRQETLHLEVRLWHWWHPVGFFQGQFILGREGSARVQRYYNYGPTSPDLAHAVSKDYKYKLRESVAGWFDIIGTDAEEITFARFSKAQTLNGHIGGEKGFLRCTRLSSI